VDTFGMVMTTKDLPFPRKNQPEEGVAAASPAPAEPEVVRRESVHQARDDFLPQDDFVPPEDNYQPEETLPASSFVDESRADVR